LIKKEINEFKENNNYKYKRSLNIVNDNQFFNLFLSIESDIDKIEILKKKAPLK
tara:strand:+ start:815 stop:976 length:162 start_codon:yes stop_codon:yes gene_type:complete